MSVTPKKCPVQPPGDEAFETHTAEWSLLCEVAASADHKVEMLWDRQNYRDGKKATLLGALRGEEGTRDMGDFGSSELFFAIF